MAKRLEVVLIATQKFKTADAGDEMDYIQSTLEDPFAFIDSKEVEVKAYARWVEEDD